MRCSVTPALERYKRAVSLEVGAYVLALIVGLATVLELFFAGAARCAAPPRQPPTDPQASDTPLRAVGRLDNTIPYPKHGGPE